MRGDLSTRSHSAYNHTDSIANISRCSTLAQPNLKLDLLAVQRLYRVIPMRPTRHEGREGFRSPVLLAQYVQAPTAKTSLRLADIPLNPGYWT